MGRRRSNLADEFTYSPTITVISPTSGPVGGGTTVTITGTSFTGATAVDFGTTAATSFTVVNNTTITAVSPAGTGIVDITIVAPTGTSATTPADRFTYAAAPVVSGSRPKQRVIGRRDAGDDHRQRLHRSHGGRFRHGAGDKPDRRQRQLDHRRQPGEPETGTVDVTVTAPGGTSATSPADQFTYVAGPTVTGLSPTFGPSVGGTLVTITGTGFTGATEVDFGTTPATERDGGRRHVDHRLQPGGLGHRQRDGDDPGRDIADRARRRIYLLADGHERQPGGRSVRRRHDGDDHRDWLRRRHRGRLRHDPGDEFHRRQQHDDHGGQSGGNGHRGRDRDRARRDVDRRRRPISSATWPHRRFRREPGYGPEHRRDDR